MPKQGRDRFARPRDVLSAYLQQFKDPGVIKPLPTYNEGFYHYCIRVGLHRAPSWFCEPVSILLMHLGRQMAKPGKPEPTQREYLTELEAVRDELTKTINELHLRWPTR